MQAKITQIEKKNVFGFFGTLFVLSLSLINNKNIKT